MLKSKESVMIWYQKILYWIRQPLFILRWMNYIKYQKEHIYLVLVFLIASFVTLFLESCPPQKTRKLFIGEIPELQKKSSFRGLEQSNTITGNVNIFVQISKRSQVWESLEMHTIITFLIVSKKHLGLQVQLYYC